MKTYSAKPTDISRKWYVLDASETTLGRLSTVAARLLIGKDKPGFTSHMDGGDFLIVINAKNLKVTGNKMAGKIYYRHSGFPGGIKSRTMQEQFDRDPSEIIRHSIRGMLPVNKLRDGRLMRLKIYNDSEHNHGAQKPEQYNLTREAK